MANSRPARGVEILLRSHDEFQPGLKYCPQKTKSLRMSKLAYSVSITFFFSDFSARLPGLKILARDRIFSPG